MTTQKPRISLTLPDDLKPVLDALAEAQGKPVSTVVVELLVEMQPQLVGITKFMRAVKSGNAAAAKTALRHTLGDGMAELLAQQQADFFDAKKKRVSKGGRATR
jgi:predicted DNA-binding protein